MTVSHPTSTVKATNAKIMSSEKAINTTIAPRRLLRHFFVELTCGVLNCMGRIPSRVEGPASSRPAPRSFFTATNAYGPLCMNRAY